MAYDHDVAIGKPLHYTAILIQQVCSFLVSVAWAGALVHARIQILFTVWLPFYGPTVIDHFMCDLFPLLKLVCMDTVTHGPFELLPFDGRYVVILYSQKNYSLEGRHKALSTHVSHHVNLILCALHISVSMPHDRLSQ